MKIFQAHQAVNACSRINMHTQDAQDALLRTIRYVRELKLRASADLAFEEFDAIERDICNLYVCVGMIRSEAANGLFLSSEEDISYTTRLSKFEARNE